MRDNMTDAELLFTSLTEMTTRQVAEKDLSVGLDENSVAAKKCGKLAGRAKDDFEKVIGRKVISWENFFGIGKKKIINQIGKKRVK